MSIRALSFIPKVFKTASNTSKCMSYKSQVSLETLYPNSQNIKPFKPPESADGKFTGYIPINELKITTMGASGPGGQHVNKINTKVDIRFHVESANWLSDTTKMKLLHQHYTRINKDGYFIIRSEKTKSKTLNQAEALNFLRELIFKLEEPEPEVSEETQEKLQKRKEKAARVRLMEKKFRSLKKANRELV